MPWQPADYIGLKYSLQDDRAEFKAFQDFWRADPEAVKLLGVEDLDKRPYLAMAHDAMLSLVLAVHEIVAAGGSVFDGVSVRQALRQVSVLNPKPQTLHRKP
jgi:hypothetical protein